MKFFSYIPSFLFVALVPYKILGIFQVDYFFRLFVGILLFFLVVFSAKEIIPFFFNLPFLQLIIFYFVSFEDYIRSRSLKYQIFLGLTIGFNLGAWPSQSDDPLFWYLSMGFLFSLYSNFKAIFLNPEFEGNFYIQEKDLDLENLSWEQIHKNMEHISIVFFGIPITNKLGPSLTTKSFPQISKRYMWSRIGRTLPRTVDSFGGGAAVGGVLGFVISEYRNQQRHNEVIAKQTEANEIARDQLKESKRANDMQERPLRLSEEVKQKSLIDSKDLTSSNLPKKGWLWSSEESSFLDKILNIF